jgi:hypothetical protein
MALLAGLSAFQAHTLEEALNTRRPGLAYALRSLFSSPVTHSLIFTAL